MSDSLLDGNAFQVSDDRRTLQHLVSAISLSADIGFDKALARLQEGIMAAAEQVSGPRTVRAALGFAHVGDPDDIARDVRTLERRDQAAEAAQREAFRTLEQEPTDEGGYILLDQGPLDAVGRADAATHGQARAQAEARGAAPQREPLTADIGAMLHDPAEQERRFQRARRAAPTMYDATDASRGNFLRQDRLLALAGRDQVATLERANRIREAQGQARQAGQRLDSAIRRGKTPQDRLIMLDGAIAELNGEAAPDSLKLLEGSPVEAVANKAAGLHERVKARLLDQRLPTGDYERVLLELVAEDAEDASQAPAQEPEPDDATKALEAGVHPGSRQLDQRIRAQLKAEGKPMSAYPEMYARMLAAGEA